MHMQVITQCMEKDSKVKKQWFWKGGRIQGLQELEILNFNLGYEFAYVQDVQTFPFFWLPGNENSPAKIKKCVAIRYRPRCEQ
jgi:hypothetical protein